MALFNCVECGKEISDKASKCPHCGMPYEQKQEVTTAVKDGYPVFDDTKPMGNKKLEIYSTFEGFFVTPTSSFKGNRSDKISLVLLEGGFFTLNHRTNKDLKFYDEQIISIDELTENDFIENNKSVIGRAIVGGLLTGGVGAIVGALSGISSGLKKVENQILVVNYWDSVSKQPESLLLLSKYKGAPQKFIELYNKRKATPISEDYATEDFEYGKILIIGVILLVSIYLIQVFGSR